MNYADLQPRESYLQSIYGGLDIKEDAIKCRINATPEELANAVSDYYDGLLPGEEHELLVEFSLALAGAERLMDAIAHGDALPDAELQAFRALCRQIEEAKRRQAQAVDEVVQAEMAS
jgi:hypothetical protein